MLDETSARTKLYVGFLALCLAAASALACCRSILVTSGFVAAVLVAGLLLFLVWRRDDVGLSTILLLAVCFRLLFLWLPPALSDDAYRYVWDGIVQAHGINPYLFLPIDAELSFLHGEPIYERLNSSTYYSVYPPVSQILFRFGAAFYEFGWQASYYVIKSSLTVCELGALWLLSRSIQPRYLMLYAWNPLVIFAAAGQAHTEAATVLFLVLAWKLADVRRPVGSSIALTLAGLVKLYPLVLLPLLWQRFGWRSVWPAGLTILLAGWPYAHPDAIIHVYSSLDLYVRSFEFNAGLYYGIKKVFELATGADWSKQIGPALRWLFLLALPAVYYIDRRKNWPIRRTIVVIIGIFFLCSTTIHPWYLLPLLALVAPVHPPSWHWWWLSLASLGTYLLYVSGPYWIWVGVGWAGWLVLGAVRYADPVLQNILRRRARGKARILAEGLSGSFSDRLKGSLMGATILDLGAAEGYVGREISRLTDADVTLADLADQNRTELPYVVFDGRRLPFATDHFFAVMLVYVLHHAASAESVLRESARVGADRIIVLESIIAGPVQGILLTAADCLANRVRSLGRKGAPVGRPKLRRYEDWIEMFDELELDVLSAQDLGGFIHRRALFVLAKDRSTQITT